MRKLSWMVAVLVAVEAGAVIPEVGEQAGSHQAPSHGLAADLANPERSQQALEAALRRSDAVQVLGEIAASPGDVAARGWAITGLARLEAASIDPMLVGIRDDPASPMLVKDWAEAALVRRVKSLSELQPHAQLQHSYPGLARPLRLRAAALLDGASLEELLRLSSDGTMSAMVVPVVLAEADPAELVSLVYLHDDDIVRRQAAAFAATVSQQRGGTDVREQVLKRLAFDRYGGGVPWAGGALYVPSVGWQGAEAKELVRTLITWWVFCKETGRTAELNQVWNNLYSVGLLQAAGYARGGLTQDSVALIELIKRSEGQKAAHDVVLALGLQKDSRFSRFVR